MADQKAWGAALFTIHHDNGDIDEVTVSGRNRWALECLIAAGESGCTPKDHPGPRWSGYVFNLREIGFIIETVHERHEGPFPGKHGRYVLRSVVRRSETCFKPGLRVQPAPKAIGGDFGACPQCGRYDEYLNVGRSHWLVCRRHRVKWCAGENLFSGWKSETEETWKQNAAILAGFREVMPAKSDAAQ